MNHRSNPAIRVAISERLLQFHQLAGELAYVRTAMAVGVVDVRRGRIVANIVPPRHLIDVISARE